MGMYDPARSEDWNVARRNIVTAYCRDCGWSVEALRIGTAEGFAQLHINLNGGHSAAVR
jgi:hypothetical protein